MVGRLNFLQFSDYVSSGIWGVVVKFCMEYSIEHWAMLLYLPSKKELVSPALSDFSSLDFSKVQGKVFWDDVSRVTYVPVLYKAKKYFVLALPLPLSSFSLFRDAVEEFCHYLQLLLSFELSQEKITYPSLYPLLYFSNDEYGAINERLKAKKNVYFLNGQKGTGKELFVDRFSLFHFSRLLSFVQTEEGVQVYSFSDHKGTVVEVWYVPEVAVVDSNWQEKICLAFEEGLSNRFIFIASVYAIKPLWSEGFISKEIYSLCELNRVLFPSLARRKIRHLVDFLFSFSGQCFNEEDIDAIGEVLMGQIKDRDFKENIDSLKEKAADRLSFRLGSGQIVGKELNDVVEALERESIKMAYDIVGQSQQKVADYLGISRGSLQYKIKKYQLD